MQWVPSLLNCCWLWGGFVLVKFPSGFSRKHALLENIIIISRSYVQLPEHGKTISVAHHFSSQIWHTRSSSGSRRWVKKLLISKLFLGTHCSVYLCLVGFVVLTISVIFDLKEQALSGVSDNGVISLITKVYSIHNRLFSNDSGRTWRSTKCVGAEGGEWKDNDLTSPGFLFSEFWNSK